MYGVVIAMIPAMLVSFYFFGLDAARVMLVSVLACLFFEWVVQKYLIKGPLTINDGSALVTGVLLAFNVPSNLPVWMTIIGAFIAIVVAKMSFGGLGKILSIRPGRAGLPVNVVSGCYDVLADT